MRSAGGVEIPAFTLSGGQLSLTGTAETTSDGFLSRLGLNATIADPSGGRVTLPVAGAATSIAAARLTIDYGNQGSEDWTAGLALNGFDNGAFTASSVTRPTMEA